MTCIVGLADRGRVYVGGDSAGVDGGTWSLTIRADSKVFRVGDMLIGYTSSFRMGQLLRYNLILPPQGAMDTPQYLATAFVDAVRDCLKAGGFAVKDKEQESGGIFLIGYRGGIYTVGSDYQVAESVDPWQAVGCGDSAALGSLYATQHLLPYGKERVLRALTAAEHYSAGVRGPFIIEEMES